MNLLVRYNLNWLGSLKEISEQWIFSFQTAKQLWDSYVSRTRSSDYGLPNSFASFGYDAAWACALTLNASIEALKETNTSLEDFNYNNTRMRKVFSGIMGRVHFHGMSVSRVFR